MLVGQAPGPYLLKVLQIKFIHGDMQEYPTIKALRQIVMHGRDRVPARLPHTAGAGLSFAGSGAAD